MKVAYIDKVNHPSLDEIVRCAMTQKVMALDFEGDLRYEGRMSLMQLAFGGGNKAFVLDAFRCPELLDKGGALAGVLENPQIIKVIHACQNDGCALKGQFGITLQSPFDTQTAHFLLSDKDPKQRQVGMNVVLSAYAGKENTQKDQVVHRHVNWNERPLPALLLDYAAQDVVHLVAVYHKMKGLCGKSAHAGCLTSILKLSLERATPRATPKVKHAHTLEAAAPTEHASTAAPRKPAAVLLKETSQAFWRHLVESNARTDGDRVLQAFNSWKATEARQGRNWKGGRGKILFWIKNEIMKRQKKAEKRKAASVKADQDVKASVLKAVKRAEANRASLEASKGGVEVSRVTLSQVIPVGQSVTQHLEIRNNGKMARELRSIKLMRSDQKDISVAYSNQIQLPLSLPPAASITVDLQIAPTCAGMLCNVLVFAFTTFSISRFLELRSGDASLLDDLKPTSPYRRPVAGKQTNTSPAVPAPRKPPKAGGKPVPFYDIPADFRHKLALGEVEDVLEEMMEWMAGDDRGEALKQHAKFWQLLLWVEEVQLTSDLASFNLTGDKATVLSKRGASELELQVAGLAEKRPSVIKGDKVRARLCLPAGAATHHANRTWEGLATYIHREDVGLRFDPAFHRLHANAAQKRVDIEFVLARMPLRICHQGLQLARSLPPDVLFPRLPVSFKAVRSGIKSFEPVNKHVGANPQQRAAVLSILQGVCRPVPYILFGPPGTGKTTTLVEAILQCMRIDGIKVLVCAPTNTAADVICERIAAPLGPIDRPAEMLRLMAYSRAADQVPPAVRKFTVQDEDGSFAMPSRTELESRRIVVASLAMAGKLHNEGIKRGHFDIIIIDEAGQAIEPETVAPVAALLGPQGQLVLAGDVKQLGPVIHSPLAKKCGLQTSFMERLMQRDVYAKHPSQYRTTHGYDPRVLTKLAWNFRSHPALLELPNTLFYDGELIPKADSRTVNNCLPWRGLENPKVPLIFHGVEGQDSREANSPSWFNADEAVLVLRYVEDLLRAQMPVRVKPSDIGVITPYNKQVHKIQKLLRGESLGDVKVGSTEMFQGSEKRVIIISTVRSSRDFITWDKQHQLGFLDNPKRFNVAVTRAACLMIVVGNPMVLVGDPCWGTLLRQCVSQGVYRGVPLPDLNRVGHDDEQEQAELIEALSGMFLEVAEEGGEGASDMIVQESAAMPEHDI